MLPDGRVWAIAGNPAAWFDDTMAAMGRPDPADDPRFATPEAGAGPALLAPELAVRHATRLPRTRRRETLRSATTSAPCFGYSWCIDCIDCIEKCGIVIP